MQPRAFSTPLFSSTSTDSSNGPGEPGPLQGGGGDAGFSGDSDAAGASKPDRVRSEPKAPRAKRKRAGTELVQPVGPVDREPDAVQADMGDAAHPELATGVNDIDAVVGGGDQAGQEAGQEAADGDGDGDAGREAERARVAAEDLLDEENKREIFDTLTTFADLGLRSSVLKSLDALGFKHPTKIQAALIPVALTGRDVLGQAKTGTGKTAAFGLPLLHMCSRDVPFQALILAP